MKTLIADGTITLREARRWCSQAHGAQTYGDKPYPYHLERVEEAALRFGFRSRIIRMACWAHDVPEDCSKTEEDMRYANFPNRVIKIAFAVKDEEGKNREERKKKTYPKIRADRLAIVVKLCDRIANVEVGEKLDMYRNEHESFKAALFDPKNKDKRVAAMWRHLDKLLGFATE